MMDPGIQKLMLLLITAYARFTTNSHSSGCSCRYFWFSAVVYQPLNIGRKLRNAGLTQVFTSIIATTFFVMCSEYFKGLQMA